MKKKILAALLLAAALLLPGCGREKQTEFQVGDRVDNCIYIVRLTGKKG